MAPSAVGVCRPIQHIRRHLGARGGFIEFDLLHTRKAVEIDFDEIQTSGQLRTFGDRKIDSQVVLSYAQLFRQRNQFVLIVSNIAQPFTKFIQQLFFVDRFSFRRNIGIYGRAFRTTGRGFGRVLIALRFISVLAIPFAGHFCLFAWSNIDDSANHLDCRFDLFFSPERRRTPSDTATVTLLSAGSMLTVRVSPDVRPMRIAGAFVDAPPVTGR